MTVCKVNKILAYSMLVYIFASIFYLIATLCVGTPFKNSLTPNQISIKKKSSRLRGKIFLLGVGIGIIICFLLEPFKSCD